MKTLIELYDPKEPICNVISATMLRPDVIVMLGDGRILRQRHQKPLIRFLEQNGIDAAIRFEPCDLYDIRKTCEGIEALLEEYGEENCDIDVTGGGDTLLMAVGLCCGRHERLRAVAYRHGLGTLEWLWGVPREADRPFRMDVKSAMALAGGELKGTGHVDRNEIDAGMLCAIPSIFDVYLRHRDGWPEFVTYMQQIDERELSDAMETSVPRRRYVGGRYVQADTGILFDLEQVGVLSGVRVSSQECVFSVASPVYLRCLRDVGIWLELYLYATMHGMNAFDSIEINAVVSWDDDEGGAETINEIDLLATAGIGQLFISCKTAVPSTAALNEVATMTERFGGRCAVSVIATAHDLKKENPALYRRAAEMGVAVIDLEDLGRDALVARLREILKRFHRGIVRE